MSSDSKLEFAKPMVEEPEKIFTHETQDTLYLPYTYSLSYV